MRVVLIDDMEEIRALLRGVLLRVDAIDVVGEAPDGESGVQLVADLRPDLVITDFTMPGIDGVETTRRAIDRHGDVEVIGFTGSESRALAGAFLEAGAAQWFDKSDVAGLVAYLTARARAVDPSQVSLRGAAGGAPIPDGSVDLVDDARRELLDRLAIVAEYRDDDTGQHTRRVGRLSSLLAERVAPALTGSMLLAAPLHDIGKLALPDAILLKRSPLDPDELRQMQRHTSIGAGMLGGSRSPLLQQAERIARSHHERWDGTGYPMGLHGARIPVEARVVAVADAFDSLVHDRPYRRAWPIERAIAAIAEEAATRFDPNIVEAFLGLDHRSLLLPPPDPREARIGAR